MDKGMFLIKRTLKRLPLADSILELRKKIKDFFIKPYIQDGVCRAIYYCGRKDVLNYATREVAEFTKEDFKNVRKKISSGERDVSNSWIRENPKEEKVLEWYKQSKEMLYGQVRYSIDSNHLNILPYIKKTLKKFYGNRKVKILDYGCGIGDHIIFLAKDGHYCTGAEVKSYSSEFIKYRIKKKGLNIRIIEITDDSIPVKENYEVIICLDVLEHTTNPQEIINKFSQKINKNGLLFINFPRSEQPLHFLHENFDLDMELFALGFSPRGIYWIKN